VVLDPQYWCARAGTPTSPDELIAVVDQTTATLADACVAIVAAEPPDCPPLPDRLPMITVRDARDRDLIEFVRRTGASKEHPTLKVADAEAHLAPPRLGLGGELSAGCFPISGGHRNLSVLGNRSRALENPPSRSTAWRVSHNSEVD